MSKHHLKYIIVVFLCLQRVGEVPARGDVCRFGFGAQTFVQTQHAARLQDPGSAHRPAVRELQRDQRGAGVTQRDLTHRCAI